MAVAGTSDAQQGPAGVAPRFSSELRLCIFLFEDPSLPTVQSSPLSALYGAMFTESSSCFTVLLGSTLLAASPALPPQSWVLICLTPSLEHSWCPPALVTEEITRPPLHRWGWWRPYVSIRATLGFVSVKNGSEPRLWATMLTKLCRPVG